MGHPYGGFDLIDVLAAGAARPARVNSDFVGFHLYLDLFGFRHHRDRNGRGVAPSRRLGLGHALNPVNSAFVLEKRVGATSFYYGDYLLESVRPGRAGA